MMGSRTLLIAAVLLIPLPILGQDLQEKAREGVTYVEYSGRSDGATRSFSTSGRVWGIDVDSRVEIRVDAAALGALAGDIVGREADASELRALVDTLSQVVASIAEIRTGYAALTERLGVLGSGNEEEIREFERDRAAVAGQALTVLLPYQRALRLRLELEAAPGEDVEGRFQQQFSRHVEGQGLVLGVQWDTVQALIQEEVAYLERAMEARAQASTISLAIQADLLRPDKTQPLALVGYNDEAVVAAQTFPRIAFAPSASEKAAFDAYEELAGRIAEAQGQGEVLRETLAAALGNQKQALLGLIEEVRGLEPLVRRLVTGLENAVQSGGAASLASLAQVEQDAASAAVRELDSMLRRLQPVLRATRDLAAFRDPGASTTPLDFLAAVDGVLAAVDDNALRNLLDPQYWEDRKAALERIFDPLSTAAESALRGVTGPLDTTFDGLATAVENISEGAKTLLQTVKSSATAVELSVPATQVARPLTEDLGTELNLQTVPGGRGPDQPLVLSYTLSRGETELLKWRDEMRVQVYGWSGSTTASLAFVRREAEGVFRPIPLLAWTLKRRSWPGDADRGVGSKPWLGFGVAALTLDYSETESVEVGVAGAISLWDMVFLGLGANLQVADDRWFGFFSFRLLEIPGVFGKVR